jgi:hypothetical protein
VYLVAERPAVAWLVARADAAREASATAARAAAVAGLGELADADAVPGMVAVTRMLAAAGRTIDA